jgi:hypothetical protein
MSPGIPETRNGDCRQKKECVVDVRRALPRNSTEEDTMQREKDRERHAGYRRDDDRSEDRRDYGQRGDHGHDGDAGRYGNEYRSGGPGQYRGRQEHEQQGRHPGYGGLMGGYGGEYGSPPEDDRYDERRNLPDWNSYGRDPDYQGRRGYEGSRERNEYQPGYGGLMGGYGGSYGAPPDEDRERYLRSDRLSSPQSDWQRSQGGRQQGWNDDYQQQGRFQNSQQHFDPDYHQWRDEQLRNLDNDYQDWRKERYQKFSDEFATWRNSRLNASQQSQGQSGSQNLGSLAGGAGEDKSQQGGVNSSGVSGSKDSATTAITGKENDPSNSANTPSTPKTDRDASRGSGSPSGRRI